MGTDISKEPPSLCDMTRSSAGRRGSAVSKKVEAAGKRQ